jgi:hypothetical protein
LCIKKRIHKNHQLRLKELRKRCRQHWNKVVANSLKNVLKKKNRVKIGRASSLGVKKEHESTDVKAQKMMKGKVELIAVPTIVHVAKQTIEVP